MLRGEKKEIKGNNKNDDKKKMIKKTEKKKKIEMYHIFYVLTAISDQMGNQKYMERHFPRRMTLTKYPERQLHGQSVAILVSAC